MVQGRSRVCHPILTPCTCADVSELVHPFSNFTLLFSFLFQSFFLMSDCGYDSVTNNLRNSDNGTFVTLDDFSPSHSVCFTSTPHRSETNGIAERAVRRVKESASAVLLQSGLNESWWADSMECDTHLRNVTDLLFDGKTPYERRFGQPFKGPIIPFGSLVECRPVAGEGRSRIHQFGKKVLPGLFFGYALYAGEIWKGDVLIADLEELETMDASEIYSKRLNAKEVLFPKQGEFIFQSQVVESKTPGGDQELRTSTLIRHRPIQGDGHVDFLGESEGSLPQPHDSLLDAGEAINDFWSLSGSFIYRHHVEPRVKLYSPREELFPIPLKYVDVTRTFHTNLDVKQEKCIDDYWNIDGSRDLSDPWTDFNDSIVQGSIEKQRTRKVVDTFHCRSRYS